MVVTRAKNWRWEEMGKDSIELSGLAKHFELYNKTEGKSPKTIDWYNMSLKQFHRFLIGSERSTILGELGEAEVREFILYLQDRAMVTNRVTSKAEIQRSPGKGPTSFKMWERRVGDAMRNLGDRSALNRSPLARIAYIERLASECYKGHLLPRGLALHDTLFACVQKISTELGNEPGLTRACNYLNLLVEGLSYREISKQLGLSREHVSRVYRPKALELLTGEFLTVIKNKRRK